MMLRRRRSLGRERRYLGEVVQERGSSMFSDEVTIRGMGSWEGGRAELIQKNSGGISVRKWKLDRRTDLHGDLLSQFRSRLCRRDFRRP
jgi:hypothetical protein